MDPTMDFPVGEIAEKDHRIYFQYDPGFLKRSLWLSPYKLPNSADLIEHKDREFGPIFGLFDDSLPDGWGLMLMDRFLKSRGFSVEKLSILDRLSFFGSSTMGALTYQPSMGVSFEDSETFDLYDLHRQSQQIVSGETQIVLSQLMKAGGSPGGARPKVLVGVSENRLISGEGDLPPGYSHWIVKFSGHEDLVDSGPVEFAYSQMAKDCDLIMPETRLFPGEKGLRFFGTKRFDRDHNKRYHCHTFGNLIHSNFRIPACDYELFFRILNNLTKNQQDLIRGFKQMIFNILANNRDDHVKNFSFLMNHLGEWSLSPAYDLAFSEGPGGEHTMTVDGEGKSPTQEHIRRLGIQSGLSKQQITQSIEEIAQIVSNWRKYAKDVDIEQSSINLIQKRIEANLKSILSVC